MAVPSYQRGTNLLQVFFKARELMIFTIRTVRNEKHFKKRYNKDLADPILILTRRIFHGVYEADQIDNTTEEGQRKRLALQEDVAMAHSSLRAELLIAHDLGLNDDKLKEWTLLLNDFQGIFNKWRKSEQNNLLVR